jgi:uncharacterized protein involved in exopolysaccharide biosynthesis
LNQPPDHAHHNRPPDVPDAEAIIDFKAIANWVRFGLHCARRHRRLLALITLSVVLLAGAAVAVLPKTYHVETKLLAQKNQVLAVKNDQGGEAPTRAAADTVLRRENLIALVKQTNLTHERTPIEETQR